MELKIFQMLEFINSRLGNIEKNIARMEEKLDFSLMISRNHLIRVKNGEAIDDQMILMGRPYNDLSPNKAYAIYKNPSLDFIILDVSHKTFHPPVEIEGALRIPLEELNLRSIELPSKTLPILIMSENGLRSIQAAESLIKKGFFNVNNISGGYEFWPENSKGKSTLETT